jgi:hypothetical protein
MDHETTMPGLLTRPAALEPHPHRPRPVSGRYKLGFVLVALALLGLACYFS